MGNLSKKISYLKGFTDALELDKKSDEGKVLSKIIDVLDEIAEEFEDVEIRQDELERQYEFLDDNLSMIENEIYGDLDDEEIEFDSDDEYIDDEEFDDDFDSDSMDYFEIQCPNCNDDVLIDYDMIDEENSIVCPNCKQEIELVFDCDCNDDDCDCTSDDDDVHDEDDDDENDEE